VGVPAHYPYEVNCPDSTADNFAKRPVSANYKKSLWLYKDNEKANSLARTCLLFKKIKELYLPHS